MTLKEREELIQRFASQIGEHFDAVQILVTWNESATSGAIYRGVGNWYARQGMAREFIEQDIAQEHAHQIAKKMPPPSNDGEGWKS